MLPRIVTITCWLLLLGGFSSFIFILLEEYGIIMTLLITLLCGAFEIGLALSLKSRHLIILGILLLGSPYILLFILNSI
ncbi:hypothetical protein CHL76_08715 [Marinococcus halophilus]|uniref:Uncharacterized protein n=1 Tax=Marinococcus halophilus TaxID=1371 RepID=A0A510Y4G5_MARHA|nr:hypothetical protein CHL76_08715 [Marinococcus halophilus]GEK58230.1 hypothetical protein MHA01_11350 [Marinococcus halophilus]